MKINMELYNIKLVYWASLRLSEIMFIGMLSLRYSLYHIGHILWAIKYYMYKRSEEKISTYLLAPL